MSKSSTKNTFQEIYEEFALRGYELLQQEYTGVKQKMKYICPHHKDKGVQEISVSKLRSGQWCKYCGRERAYKNRALSEEELKKRCEAVGFEFVGRDGTSHNIRVICPIHRDKGVQNVPLSSITMGRHCKYCAGNVKLTQEEYVQRVAAKLPHIEIRSQYSGQKSKVVAYCKKHDVQWECFPGSLFQENSCGCSECIKDRLRALHKISREQRIKDLEKNNPDIELISDECGTGDTVTFRCKICSYTWNSICANDYYSGRYNCPKCSHKKQALGQRKSNEVFLHQLKIYSPHIIALEEYNGHTNDMRFFCTKHNYEFISKPAYMLKNSGCPNCTSKHTENRVATILDSVGVSYIREMSFDDCRDKNALSFDYYVPDHNLIIEYDGEGHYMPIHYNGCSDEEAQSHYQYTVNHDNIKNDYCMQNGINLVRIPYWEKDNMEDYLVEHAPCLFM